jgi:probable F420-dependent oxidoreductase
MRIGIGAYDLTCGDLVNLAVAAEEFGFDALWLSEHTVLPVGYRSEHAGHHEPGNDVSTHIKEAIVDESTRLLDLWVSMAAIAASTSTLRIGCGVYLLPLRHPLHTARAACTLQELAGGRFSFGIGAGWMREEFEALAVPFDARQRLLDECAQVIRAALLGGPFSHRGEFYQFDDVQITPHPVHVPLIYPGNGPKGLRRAVSIGDGWFAAGVPTPPSAVQLQKEIDELRSAGGRDGEFPCYFRVATADSATIVSYAEQGIDDVIVWFRHVWPDRPLSEQRETLAAAAREFGIHPE